MYVGSRERERKGEIEEVAADKRFDGEEKNAIRAVCYLKKRTKKHYWPHKHRA